MTQIIIIVVCVLKLGINIICLVYFQKFRMSYIYIYIEV